MCILTLRYRPSELLRSGYPPSDTIEQLKGLKLFHSRGSRGGRNLAQGGDLGWFSPEQMVAPFSEAVGALEDNAYSKEAVQTQFGWHVILREGSRDNEPPPLDSVRDSVKQSVEQQKLQNYIESLRAGNAGND